MKKELLIIILAIWCFGAAGQNINTEKIKPHIEYLASDMLKGRKPGTQGDELAANYIVDHFRKMGLTLLGENGFEYFDVVTDVKLGKGNFFEFNNTKAELNTEFVPCSFSENSIAEAEIVFAGYGLDINNDSIKWTDFDGIDVANKWVMVLRGDPELDSADSKYAEFSEEKNKVLTAKDKGAIGVLLVTPVLMNGKDELMNLIYDKSSVSSGIPVINISRKLANQLLATKDTTSIEFYEEKLNSNLQPVSFSIPAKVRAKTEVLNTTQQTQNIVALMKGSDPVLSSEYIVVGGHYDHLGMGGKGSGSRMPDTSAVHNGADDNASGIAAIIEMAYHFAKEQEKFKRSILFIAFGAEEMGLLGSKHFMSDSLIDISQIKAMLNIDMIGRMQKDPNTLMIGGTGTSPETETILTRLNEKHKLELNMSPEGFGPSDHASFYSENIPVFFFSAGAHSDYHTPFDDVDQINFNGMKVATEFSINLIEELVNRDSALTFQEAGPKTRSNKGRRFKVTLGIIPDFARQNVKGLGVGGVTLGGPAYSGGLLKGDIIVALDGKEVTSIYDYMFRLKKLESGQTITVDVIREGERKVLIVQL